MTSPLFKPLQLGAISLSHRVVMAPLTRMRAGAPDNVPTERFFEPMVGVGLGVERLNFDRETY